MDQQQINETDISSLPPEMIIKIFQFLSFRERLQASRTCKQWHQLAFNPRKIRIRINDRKHHLPSLRDIRDYHKYRNATIDLETGIDRDFQAAVADFITTVPLESLEINSAREPMQAMILDDHLPRMSALTRLRICVTNRENGDVTINHPTLKSVSLGGQSGWERFKVNCPSLTDLEIYLSDVNSVSVVIQLQHQLQSLHLIFYQNQHHEALEKANLSNLKKLCLTLGMDVQPILLDFSRMVNLKELKLFNLFANVRTVGEELSVLTSLSVLTLSTFTIDGNGFAAALRKMVQLRDLELLGCEFIEWCRIASDHLEYFHVDCKASSVVLPQFPKLKKLSVSYCCEKEVDDTFVQICDFYPELQKLRFGATSEFKGNFRSSTSFANIRKLKFLKDLHLVGLDLDGIAWTECNDSKVVNLQLHKCTIQVPDEARRLAESIGRGLRKCYLDACKLRLPRTDVVGIEEQCVQDLRNSLPWCRVSFKDCEVIDKVCD